MSKLRSTRGLPITGKPHLKRLTSRRGGVNDITPVNRTSLTSRRSEQVSASPESVPYPFDVRRGYEGVQLVINWASPPVVCDEIRIVRALDKWPENINDGFTVVSDNAPLSVFSFSDMKVGAYKVYYYVLFARRVADGAWIQPYGYRDKEFPLPTGYFKDKLFGLLPDIYHRVDGEA